MSIASLTHNSSSYIWADTKCKPHMIIKYDRWKHQIPKILDNEDKSTVQMVEKSRVASSMPRANHVDTNHTRA